MTKAQVLERGEMLRVAVVDDEPADAQKVIDYLNRYYEGDASRYRVTVIKDGEDLLLEYKPVFDLIFLDVEMPRMGGIECARLLRAIDREVAIVYVTNMAQYAATGYEVDALGYLVKPLRYYSFALAMGRVDEWQARRRGTVLWLADGDGRVALSSRDLRYIEVRKHELSFHADSGATYLAWGSLKEYEELLAGAHFYKCNRYYLINLEHVTRLRQDSVEMDSGEVLEVSRRNKKGLMEALTDFYGSR